MTAPVLALPERGSDMERNVKALRALAVVAAGVGWRASRGSDGESD